MKIPIVSNDAHETKSRDGRDESLSQVGVQISFIPYFFETPFHVRRRHGPGPGGGGDGPASPGRVGYARPAT
jgi:hypothetical protein